MKNPKRLIYKIALFLALLGLGLYYGFILFAFFIPAPSDWFPGARETLRHALSKDTGNEERLRHIILSSRKFQMGHSGGVHLAYTAESATQMRVS